MFLSGYKDNHHLCQVVTHRMNYSFSIPNMVLEDHDEPGNKCGRDGQNHSDEGAFDMEPVVVVILHHVLGPFDHEMLVVAEPHAVQHDRVEPVHDAPEGVGREDPAPEGCATVDVSHEQAQQHAEYDEGEDLLRIEAWAAGTVSVVHEAEGAAAFDDGRGIVEYGLHRVPGHQENEQGKECTGYDGFDEKGHIHKVFNPLLSNMVFTMDRSASCFLRSFFETPKSL